MEVDDPKFLLPDWVICEPRLTGICGSDSKQVFMDWGEVDADNPMIDFTSFPHILGHEVVADVVALGPEAEGLEVGQRVVLNPWLSCAPRGVQPLCPACEIGDLSLCWNFQAPPIATGHPLRDVEGCERRLRDPDARARLDVVPGARLDPRRDRGVRRSVRGVVARGHPPRTARGRPRAGVRRRCARFVSGRDPARAVPGRRGGCGCTFRRAGRPGCARSVRPECSRTSHSPR